jgi:hypothetical protein
VGYDVTPSSLATVTFVSGDRAATFAVNICKLSTYFRNVSNYIVSLRFEEVTIR